MIYPRIGIKQSYEEEYYSHNTENVTIRFLQRVAREFAPFTFNYKPKVESQWLAKVPKADYCSHSPFRKPIKQLYELYQL